MINFKLDADGDLDVSSGNIALIKDGAATVQDIQTRMQLFKGEWFLDQNAGIPYYQSVLTKNTDPSALRSIFRKAILAASGVESLLSLDLTLDKQARKLSIAFQVQSIYGPLAGKI